MAVVSRSGHGRYGLGDQAALDRVIRYFRADRAVAWDKPAHDVLLSRVRRALQSRLEVRPGPGPTESALREDDARWLVARAEGYADWAELAREASA